MEQTTHYEGRIKLEFNPDRHYYTINGERAWGVTTALGVLDKPALIPWATGCAAKYFTDNVKPGQALDEVQIQELAKDMKWAHRRKKDKAADMGTWVHNYAEEYAKGNNPDMPVNPQLQKSCRAFKKWFDEQDIEVIQAEMKLCSPTLMLAGTVDLICRMDGKLTIIDWKTGSGIYPTMFLQMGAYAHMYEEEFGEKVEQVGVVNCPVRPDKYFQTKFDDKVAGHKKTYLKVLEVKKLIDEMGGL